MIENAKQLTECCACGSEDLRVALDLGQQPLANSYLKSPIEPETAFPLTAMVCTECCHVQLSHAIHPDLMFKNYLYVSGTTDTLKKNMLWFTEFVQEYTNRNYGNVLDIGCNDGTQLDFFKEKGWKTYGIDPAENIVPTAVEKGHDVACGYFTAEVVPTLRSFKPDVIVAQNVVAHNYDALRFLENVRDVMHKDTVFFMQISQVDMIRNNEFDTCYHEHINFFNVQSLSKIAERAGLFIQDIVKQPIHGNSYIVIMSTSYGNPYRIENLIALDRADGMYDLSTYERWGTNARRLMDELNATVANYRSQGFKVVGYGAAAKGMVVTNFAELDLDFIIDDNPLKQGRYTPGRHTPIVSIDELQKYENVPLVFVPLAWNFFDEIQRRVQAVRANPDHFIRYFPEVEIVT
jgi:SAM-dependent methyltransferase